AFARICSLSEEFSDVRTNIGILKFFVVFCRD
ncbi:MAG: hypothetical protein ACI89T_002499, partial [Cognaticolwellia sp.]